LLALTDIDALADRRPATISGGQAQRVALARAIGRDAPLLLLDEPFSALDEEIRDSLRRELRRLCRELGRGALFVTHDLREAYLLADRLMVLVDGRVLQSGPPDEPFLRPVNRRVAVLMGFRNIFRGEVVGRAPGAVDVAFAGHRWRCASWWEPPAVGQQVDVAIRAERVALRRPAAGELTAPNIVEAQLIEDDSYGLHHLLRFRAGADGLELEVDLPARPYRVLGVAERGAWTLELAPHDLHVMPASVR
jgi:ABC-type Fe3+/spermidine/putrescine transport system ATPase subunit